jgi:hypothetical protein
MGLPYITNRSPERNANNVASGTLISFDIVDEYSDLRQDTLKVYVKGATAYDGSTNLFSSPYDSPGSSITPTSVGGHDGYHIIIDAYEQYANVVTVRVEASDALNSIDGYWGFIINNKVNTLYFSDGYGLKSIDIENLVGECQTEIKTVLSTSTIPRLPTNNVSHISGNMIDGYFCLALCCSAQKSTWSEFVWGSLGTEGYGTQIVKNEVEIETYADGYITDKAQINNDGTLYLLNKETNSIEVYYGSYFRDGYRNPDFIYNSSSTPNIVLGNVLSLHIVNGESTRLRNGTRIYVGTTQGVTRIEAYDKHTDGYSDGYDSYGVSMHYGISGSGIQYEVIGGTVSQVTSVSSDDENGIMFVVTNDGYGNGGVTQVSISQNRNIYYMTQASGFIPSNDIRDVFGKGLEQ